MPASKFLINKVCLFCSKLFEAHRPTTQYCSHICNSRHYKDKKRLERVEQGEQVSKELSPTASKRLAPEQSGLQQREFLSVSQASQILGCSRQTMYNLIQSGKLKAVNLSERKTIIKRSDIDRLFA
jgi:excisionase family DNA binding protein